ncbi:MAG: hypothetical protein JSS78_11130 [Bacteroidetes bacterium]|nr:hypothetical protein [Bacteroidota bacterium]
MPKLIQNDSNYQTFNNSLGKDLDFILKKHRFPIKWYHVFSLILILSSVWIMSILITISPKRPISYMYWLMLAITGGITILSLWRTIQSMRFIKLKTGKSKLGNMSLLECFMSFNHFLVYRHPIYENVFMIGSRQLADRGNMQEFLVFIAIDDLILMNSHFVNNALFQIRLLPPLHVRSMRDQLASFINDISISGTNVQR